MSKSQYPAGWDADRVKRLVDHYESLSEEEMAAEDDVAAEEGAAKPDRQGQSVVVVPDELLPAIRYLIATHKAG